MNGRTGHRRIRQPLAKRRLDRQTHRTAGLFDRLQRIGTGDANAVDEFGWNLAQHQLFFNLRAGARNQHNAHTHRNQQADIEHQILQIAVVNQFTAKSNDKGFVVKGMYIRRDIAQPLHELMRQYRSHFCHGSFSSGGDRGHGHIYRMSGNNSAGKTSANECIEHCRAAIRYQSKYKNGLRAKTLYCKTKRFKKWIFSDRSHLSFGE